MFIFRGPISASNVILFLFSAVAINASPCKNCYGWHARFKIQLFLAGLQRPNITRSDLMKSKIFVVYVNIVHIVFQTTECTVYNIYVESMLYLG